MESAVIGERIPQLDTLNHQVKPPVPGLNETLLEKTKSSFACGNPLQDSFLIRNGLNFV